MREYLCGCDQMHGTVHHLATSEHTCQGNQPQPLQPQQRLPTLQVLLAEPTACNLRRLG